MSIFFIILLALAWCYLLFLLLFCPSRDEVNKAMSAGVINDRREKFSKKCRLFLRINRDKNLIRSLKNDINACVLEFNEEVKNEKKNG